ncbi:hypothetical protein JHW43_002091 [Diplocarpon mali]|nr:hypothetical protein JHW43_002091 [Diplocarpon mali]
MHGADASLVLSPPRSPVIREVTILPAGSFSAVACGVAPAPSSPRSTFGRSSRVKARPGRSLYGDDARAVGGHDPGADTVT